MIINNNVEFLSKTVLDNIKQTKDNSIQFKESKDGLPVPMVNNIALHSAYYPLKEAERINKESDEKKLCIAIGFGAGYHLTGINKEIIAISVSHETLSNVLEKIDLSKWFSKDKLRIINEDEIVEYFDFFNYSSFYFIIHPVLERLFPDRVKEIINKVIELLREPLLEMNTQRKFGRLWFKNILSNIKYFIDDNCNFEPLTIGAKPILVTGAGPSLVLNIDKIKSERNKLFIASADTSFKILLKYNIIPDAIFSFDSQHYTYLHFAGIKNTPRLFTDITSPIRLNKNQTILFSNHPVEKVFKKSGWNPVYLPSDTRNIGSAVISFFQRYFNEHTIVTAGIDYGIFENTIYSKGSYIDDYIYSTGNYFNSVTSQFSKLLYRDNFSKKINGWKTTLLFEEYSKNNSANKVYTLSSSPFTGFTRITSLQEAAEQSKNIKEKILIFEKPQMQGKEFINAFTDNLKNYPEVLDSYFLSIGRQYCTNEMNKIILIIKEIFN